MRLCIVGIATFTVVTALSLLAGCKLNEDKVVSDFCSFYPEVCQYVDFD